MEKEDISCSKKIDVKLLILLTIPIFIELILQLLAGNVDKVMVSDDNLATAINQANTILDLLVVSLSVLSAASLVLINQYKGAGDKIREAQVYKLSFYFNLFIGIIISIILVSLAWPFLKALQVSDEVLPSAVLYLRITGSAVFLQAMMLSLASYLRSNDMMIKSMIVSIVFNVVNIGLNALFLYVLLPNDKIVAVALGSVISRVVGAFLLLLMVVFKLKLDLKLKGLFPLKVSELKKIIMLGIPSAGESFSYSMSQIVILALINLIGSKTIGFESYAPAAKTYASMIVMFTYLFVSAISQGMQILLGRYLGAGNKELANKLVWKTTIISLVVNEIFAVVIALISHKIFGLLTSDKEVIDLAVKIMFVEIYLEFGRAINIVMVRALQTAGDVLFPTICAIVSCWIVATLGSFIFGYVFKFGLVGVWFSMATDEFIRCIIFLFRWHGGKWKNKNLVKN